jgi:hypothetical protein
MEKVIDLIEGINSMKSDLISRQDAIALADKLKDDLPDDERIADAAMAHNEGILEYQTALSLLPSAQPEIIRCKDCKFYTEIRTDLKTGICSLACRHLGDDGFCSEAERRSDG